MVLHKSPSDRQTGAASPALPSWMHRTTPYAPERRARMLEHMARARSLPQPQAATVPAPSRTSGVDILGDAFGYMVLFGVIALLFQSRVPLYLGAFLFLTDGERIEHALGTVGIRLEPDTVGPDIIKGFASLFGWFALLASLQGSVPAWLAAWMPPDTSWSAIAGIAVVFATVEASAGLAMRHALPWFGFQIRPDSLTATTIKLLMALGLLALLVLLGSL
ncbi:hypothetical protein BjapCC829_22115 [Bradyrhizobium barranii]|jgi:hypothetical protein|uniref:Uncharacterized protein n=1 Tax=Bradyrhizobium barranii TaxID=2992140 RepID=A0ABY3QYL5_9BRAD|nr:MULTISPECIES: hypothetical protein [Bradyrhizobium]UFW91084.1 hypothetical protein BjapCC829_22115 [Bradyrhizobium japonicum]